MEAKTLRQGVTTFLVLLGVAVLVAGLIASTQGELHTVVLITDSNFGWRVTGYIKYTYDGPQDHNATIQTSDGSITVKPGDCVRIVVDTANYGKMWFGTDGWMEIDNLPVEAIYINDELVASDTVIIWTNMHYDLQSLVSTLKIEVTLKQGEEYGWAQLTVDNQDLVNQWNYCGYFVVYNIAPSQSKNLNLDIGSHYLESVAEGIEWVDESGNISIIGVDELPFPRLLLG